MSIIPPIGAQQPTLEEIEALKKFDELSEKYKKQNKMLESLEYAEKALILRGHVFGLDSEQVTHGCKQLCEMCNYLAMIYLQQESFDLTLDLLNKAEVLSEKLPLSRAITLNNLACYHRKRGQHRRALTYCQRALVIERESEVPTRSADTHLNLCTILSDLERHEDALLHAQQALQLLLIELFGTDDEQEIAQRSLNTHQEDPSNSSSSDLQSLPTDRVAVLAIAYHNLAVQQEFLRYVPLSKKFPKSSQFFLGFSAQRLCLIVDVVPASDADLEIVPRRRSLAIAIDARSLPKRSEVDHRPTARASASSGEQIEIIDSPPIDQISTAASMMPQKVLILVAKRDYLFPSITEPEASHLIS